MPYKDPAKRREANNRWLKNNRDKASAAVLDWIRRNPEKRAKYNENNKVKQMATQQIIDRIKMHYGCCNPKCGWTSKLKPYQLEFHHLQPQDKTASICQIRKANSFTAKLRAEINKCTVLCGNCHALETHTVTGQQYAACCVDEAGNPVVTS